MTPGPGKSSFGLEPSTDVCSLCSATTPGARDKVSGRFLPRRGPEHGEGCAYRAVREPTVEMVIDRRLLQIVFDVAVESMDFSSGFLDDEEVDALREVAVVLGVDPMIATPENFKCKFDGKHDFSPRPDGDYCWRCKQTVKRST